MMVVPNNEKQARAVVAVDAMATDYARNMADCQKLAQLALVELIDAGFDPGVAVHIVNGKFRMPPPKEIGAEPGSEEQVSVHIPDLIGTDDGFSSIPSNRIDPDDYEEDE